MTICDIIYNVYVPNLYASSDNSPTPPPPSQFSADWVDVVLCAVWLIENSTLFGWRTEKCLQVTQNYNSTIPQPLIFVAIVLLCVCIFASHLTAGKNQPLRSLLSSLSWGVQCTTVSLLWFTYLYVLDIFQSWWYYDLVCRLATHSSCLRWHHYLLDHQY